MFPSSFTTGSLSGESDKESKLSFGRVDDKESFLRLESKIQMWIFTVFLIYLHYTQILHELLWFLQISISLFIFLYTSYCTKNMNYISLYAINKKNTPTKDLNTLKITYQNFIDFYLKINFWNFAIKHLLRTIVSTDQYLFKVNSPQIST